MTRHTTVSRLRERLEKSGFRTSDRSTGFLVRLALFTSLRVDAGADSLTLEPRFGAVSRSTGTVLFTVFSALFPILVLGGLAPPPETSDRWFQSPAGVAWFLLMVVLAAAHECMRCSVTEGAMTRIMLIWKAGDDAA